MKSNWYYQGIVELRDHKKGVRFVKVDDKGEVTDSLVFEKPKNRDFSITAEYEIDVNDDKINVGTIQFLNNYLRNEEIENKWKVENRVNEDKIRLMKFEEKDAKEKASLENMTLRQIRDKLSLRGSYNKSVIIAYIIQYLK